MCLVDAQTLHHHAHHGHYAVDSFVGTDNGTGCRSQAEDLFNAMLAIAIVRIPLYARRGAEALVVRQYTYVQAAKTFGASHWHLINWHILRIPTAADRAGIAGYR